MDIQPLDIAIHIVNIAVLYVLLRVILYNPVQKFMEQRSAAISKKISDADAAKEGADKLREEFSARLKNADQEVQHKLIDGTKAASEQADAILSAAKAQSELMLQKAQDQVRQQRRDAIAQLQPQISEMAVSLAGQILKREVNAADNQKVIESFFEKEVHRS